MTATATSKTEKTSFNEKFAADFGIITEIDDFDTTFVNPCLSGEYAVLTATAQSPDSFTDHYSGTTNTFNYNPFTVTPNICPL